MRKNADARCGFAAAYREGLGLAAVVVVGDTDGTGIAVFAASQVAPAAAETVQAHWWCRRAVEAEGVAAAAARLLRRRTDDRALPGAAVAEAAKKLGIAIFSDEEIAAEADSVIARVEAEMQKQQQSGALKSVNRAYRAYRLETSARGERVLRYDEWIRKYKESLIRQVASALR